MAKKGFRQITIQGSAELVVCSRNKPPFDVAEWNPLDFHDRRKLEVTVKFSPEDWKVVMRETKTGIGRRVKISITEEIKQ